MEEDKMPGRHKRGAGGSSRRRGDRGSARPGKKDRKKRTKSLMLLQQDLFVMTCTTVFRNLEEEGQYTITQNIRDRFNAKELYEEALAADIPWRQWNHWVRAKVVDYLKRHEEHDGDEDGEDEKCSVM